MIRGLAEYCNRNGAKLDIHLVRKGRHISETLTTRLHGTTR
jgi:hypothetical protein